VGWWSAQVSSTTARDLDRRHASAARRCVVVRDAPDILAVTWALHQSPSRGPRHRGVPSRHIRRSRWFGMRGRTSPESGRCRPSPPRLCRSPRRDRVVTIDPAVPAGAVLIILTSPPAVSGRRRDARREEAPAGGEIHDPSDFQTAGVTGVDGAGEPLPCQRFRADPSSTMRSDDPGCARGPPRRARGLRPPRRQGRTSGITRPSRRCHAHRPSDSAASSGPGGGTDEGQQPGPDGVGDVRRARDGGHGDVIASVASPPWSDCRQPRTKAVGVPPRYEWSESWPSPGPTTVVSQVRRTASRSVGHEATPTVTSTSSAPGTG